MMIFQQQLAPLSPPPRVMTAILLFLAVIFGISLSCVVVDAFQQQRQQLQYHHLSFDYCTNNRYGDRMKIKASNCYGIPRNHHRRRSVTTGFFSQSTSSSEETRTSKPKRSGDFFKDNEQAINDFCIGTNEFWKKLVIKPVRDYVEIQIQQPQEGQPYQTLDIFEKLIAPPQLPGISRPVWFTILGSVPTALGWYGYYKFSVEEELYQYELQQGKPVTGCGGYGTLFPFVYGVIVGFPLSLLPIDGSGIILEAAAFWILIGQVNLYRRVNELCLEQLSSEEGEGAEGKGDGELSKQLNNDEPPLHAWWALLPPPLGERDSAFFVFCLLHFLFAVCCIFHLLSADFSFTVCCIFNLLSADC